MTAKHLLGAKEKPVKRRKYACDKCAGTRYKAGKIRTTGSGISRFLNLQNQKFATVSCSNCGYTEIYRMDSGGTIADVFDILTN